jgi:hypothetical protein
MAFDITHAAAASVADTAVDVATFDVDLLGGKVGGSLDRSGTGEVAVAGSKLGVGSDGHTRPTSEVSVWGGLAGGIEGPGITH